MGDLIQKIKYYNWTRCCNKEYLDNGLNKILYGSG